MKAWYWIDASRGRIISPFFSDKAKAEAWGESKECMNQDTGEGFILRFVLSTMAHIEGMDYAQNQLGDSML